MCLHATNMSHVLTLCRFSFHSSKISSSHVGVIFKAKKNTAVHVLFVTVELAVSYESYNATLYILLEGSTRASYDSKQHL